MPSGERLTLFLCGDVMSGRGVDQILACLLRFAQPHARSALEYVALAEQANGPIPRRWTTLTSGVRRSKCGPGTAGCAHREPGNQHHYQQRSLPQRINYRMHPANARVLEVPQNRLLVLANNHVLDWGRAGLGKP